MNKPFKSVAVLARVAIPASHVNSVIELLEGETRWESWLEQVEMHGLSGLASQHIDEYNLPIPDETRLTLRVLNMRHKGLAQARYEALSELLALYKKNKVAVLALKGAALMPYIYKKPELRPMRDTDLLVPLSQLEEAARLIEENGFELDEWSSRFTRGIHQLPNATKQVNGFTCSVELHKESIPRDVKGTLPYPKDPSHIQCINWNELSIECFDDITMLHQVARHLEGLHPNELMKLINMVDVVALAELIESKGHWNELVKRYPHVINALECLHLITPLPANLQAKVNTSALNKTMSGVAEIMPSFRSIMVTHSAFFARYKALFFPSQWWLHLHYNVSIHKSLWFVKMVRHPIRVMTWVAHRLYVGLVGDK